MEILQFLISLLKDNQSLQAFMPIIDNLRQNNFDLKSFLSSLNPETIRPLIQGLMQFMQTKNPTQAVGLEYALSPISDIADKDIIYSLNKYLSQGSVVY